ncbi:MAG: alpha/beta fold hydrolase, partial [Patescibacteria group bacterium]|nr:alpha/beta fold hydrolase [Patescibacteria group bacterium]
AFSVFFPRKKLSDFRGKWTPPTRHPLFKGSKEYFVTYHPAAGIRFPKIKNILEKDFEALTKDLNIYKKIFGGEIMKGIKEKLVFFKNKKGERLWGIITLPAKEKNPGLIICHGFGGSKSRRKYTLLSRALAQDGIASFRFDFSGHGDSEGEFEELSIEKQVSELNSAFKRFAREKRIDREKIAILGHSLGALVGVLFQTKYKKAKALILVAPAIDQKELIKKWFTPEEIRKWKKQEYLDTEKGRVGVQYLKEVERSDYFPLLSEIRVPTLILQGEKDEDVPKKFSKAAFEKLGCQKKRFILVKEVEHHFESKKAVKALISESLSWLKQNFF